MTLDFTGANPMVNPYLRPPAAQNPQPLLPSPYGSYDPRGVSSDLTLGGVAAAVNQPSQLTGGLLPALASIAGMSQGSGDPGSNAAAAYPPAGALVMPPAAVVPAAPAAAPVVPATIPVAATTKPSGSAATQPSPYTSGTPSARGEGAESSPYSGGPEGDSLGGNAEKSAEKKPGGEGGPFGKMKGSRENPFTNQDLEKEREGIDVGKDIRENELGQGAPRGGFVEGSKQRTMRDVADEALASRAEANMAADAAAIRDPYGTEAIKAKAAATREATMLPKEYQDQIARIDQAVDTASRQIMADGQAELAAMQKAGADPKTIEARRSAISERLQEMQMHAADRKQEIRLNAGQPLTAGVAAYQKNQYGAINESDPFQ